MISVKISEPTEDVTLPNQELVRAILSMPYDEYSEILTGIIKRDKLDVDRLMIIFAYIGNRLKNSELDPSQKNALDKYIREFND